jgi:DNA-binding transcriptional LysR family regulator
MSTSHEANLRNIDLNLLVAFIALVEELSVTKAAKRVGLSQPAMSNALGRLRDLFHDTLLVRSSRAMVATPVALALVAPIRRALSEIAETVAQQAPFDPATSTRTFRMAMTDYSQFVLLPKLRDHLADVAPSVEVVVRPLSNVAGIRTDLEEGPLDLAIATGRGEAPGFHRRELFRDRYVCLMKEGIRGIGQKLSLAQYLALPHILVAPQGGERGFIDEMLAKHGKERRIVLRLPDFAVAPWVVAESDVVATLPSRIASLYAKALRLRVLDVPLPLGTTSWAALWHDRVDGDRWHSWMRKRIAEVSASLPTVPA